MERYPGAGDELTITTWPDKNLKAVFTRYFCLDSEDGLHYGSGVSQWVLFHVDKRTVVRPSECEIRFPEVISRQAPLTMQREIFTRRTFLQPLQRTESAGRSGCRPTATLTITGT